MKQTNQKEQYEKPLLLDIAPVSFVTCQGQEGYSGAGDPEEIPEGQDP